eukprot:13502728-Ditylum_brightwellii.AAC.1
MFPFAIFFNHCGCKTRCEYKNKGKAWLSDVLTYYNNMPEKLKNITSKAFDINQNMDIMYHLKERSGITIIHWSPHANKHLQLSSFCNMLVKAQTTLPWWNEYYIIEYLYFDGLVCTPVSPWFAMTEVMKK